MPSAKKLPVLRIAVWQVALVLGFAAIGRDDLGAGVGLGLAAALTLTVSALRLRGEWLSTVALRWAGFVLRRRQWDGEHVPLPRDAAISSAGVLGWADGVTAVARTSSFGFPVIEADGPRLDLQLVAHLGPRQARPGGWLAITARRDADNATDDELRVLLDNAVRRLRKAAPTGFALLSGREVRAVVSGIAHAGPSRETWRYWRSGPITHITLRATGLAVPDLIERLLAEGRDAAVTVAVRADGGGVVRVAAPAVISAERAVRRIADICTRRGVRLERLDGRHGPAVLASLPIGGEF
ncbi:hypothetical protein [Actinoplanes sp. NBRC 103695]|uniref:hypothetical protein n=1 Tax=Actinoplanes sp. NBRC 103695 TaxID=3032202 RepID=UPI002554F96A|nr:hypothetical protein [Actinoplanes sp. NBRC 103695]